MMLNVADLQNSYNKVYKQLRKYLWDFPVVEAIANLEISVYKIFPDMQEVKLNFNKLYTLIYDIVYQDEELSTSLDIFEKLLDNTTTYSKLNQVNEVIQ